MISPTSRAIILACLGAPLSLLLATMVAGNLWPIGAAWALGICALVAIDGLLAAAPGRMRVGVVVPTIAPMGAGPIDARLQFECAGAGPASAEVALETNHILQQPRAPQRVRLDNGR